VNDYLNLLIAYPYYLQPPTQELLKGSGRHLRFVLDSGAFTAWKSGNPIELDAYCKFVESCKPEPWRYFALDVIGDPAATIKNYEIMLKRGFNPIPVFTRGECPSVLETFYETSEVVAIGGLVGTLGNKGFVKGIMKYIKNRWVHWLGFTNLDFVKYYKPYMCDSSTWESGARYGNIPLYMGNGKLQMIGKSDFQGKPNQQVLDRIQQLGIDPYLMSKTQSWHGGNSVSRTLCARSGVALSVDVERKTSTKLFLASATTLAVELLKTSFEKLYQFGAKL